jgi:hypothetical protein
MKVPPRMNAHAWILMPGRRTVNVPILEESPPFG